jgi:hypothetical protein
MITQDYDKEVFIERIKQSEDTDLFNFYKKRSDYQPLFVKCLEEELAVRGYNVADIDSGDTNRLILNNKSNEQLINIITNYTDYNKGWDTIARTILESRGFDTLSLYSVAKNKTAILKDGKPGKHIIAGYIFSLLGGLLGLIIALDYTLAKVTTVNGEVFPKYNKKTRESGKIMLVIIAVVVTISIIVNL